MDANGAVLNPLSKRIIGCGLKVVGTLGNGFLERVYENALAHELRKAGLNVEQQRASRAMSQLFARDRHALVSSHELWPATPGGASDCLRSVISISDSLRCLRPFALFAL